MKITQEILKEIILEEKLSSFILGDEEFLTDRPEIDYSRWGELHRFYETLNIDSPLRRKIDDTIIILYAEASESKKQAAVAVGRLLQLQSIKQKIINAFDNSEIPNYGQNLQNEFLFSATILQLSEVASSVIKIFTSEGRLGEFIMCSSIPSYVEQVGEDDIWRIEVMDAFFEDSDNDTRESIYSQANETAMYSKNFCLAIRKYLTTDVRHREFHLMLEKIVGDINSR